MPRVPKYTQQVQFQAPNVQAGRVPEPIREAYGQDIAQAQTGFGAELSRAGERLAEHAISRMKSDEEALAMGRLAEFENQTNELLYNKDSGLLNKKLDDAKDLSVAFEKWYGEREKSLKEEKLSSYARDLLSKGMLQHVNGIRGTVIRHEADQADQAHKVKMDAMIDSTIKTAASLSGPKEFLAALELGRSNIQSRNDRAGIPEERTNLDKAMLADEMAKEHIGALLDNSPLLATQRLKELAPVMTPAGVASIQRAIDSKVFEEKKEIISGDLIAKHLGADGTFKYDAVLEDVKGRGLTPVEEQAVMSRFEGRVNDLSWARKQDEAANSKAFEDEVYTMKNQGATPDQIKKALIPKYQRGPADLADKSKLVDKAFESAVIDDSALYGSLWLQLQNNQIGLKDINANLSQLSASNAKKLRDLWYANIANPKSGFANSWEDLKAIGPNPKKKDKFNRFVTACVVRMQTEAESGKIKGTGVDLLNIAREEMKAYRGDWYKPWSSKKAYDLEVPKDQNSHEAKAKQVLMLKKLPVNAVNIQKVMLSTPAQLDEWLARNGAK